MESESKLHNEVEKPKSIDTKITELVDSELEHRFETDNAGFKRKIYRYRGYEISFRGREEIPILDSINACSPILLGSEPIFIPDQEYDEYKRVVESERIEGKKPDFLLVTKDLDGVIGLAKFLDSDNPDIDELESDIHTREYSKLTYLYLDKLIATNWIQEDGKELDSIQNGSDAEMIVLLSLMGNQKATQFVERKVTQLEQRNIEVTKKRREYLENSIENHYKFGVANPKKVVSVHSTKYKPYKNGDNYEVPTTYDATKNTYLRNTVHVALGHKVKSHGANDWSINKYTIVAPFADMCESNGPPVGMEEVDTWWSTDPKRPLEFTNGVLVHPGQVLHGYLYDIREGETTFKGEGYTCSDIRGLLDYERYFDTAGWRLWSPNTISLILREEITDIEINNHIPLGKLEDQIQEALFRHNEDRVLAPSQEETFLNELIISQGEKDIYKGIYNMLDLSEIRTLLSQNGTKFEEFIQSISEKINRRIYDTINRLAVNMTIKKLGGNRSEEGFGGSLAVMGYRLGVLDVYKDSHSDSPERYLTNIDAYNIQCADPEFSAEEEAERIRREGIKQIKRHINWKDYNPQFFMSKLGIKELRILYDSGRSVSRY
jgi:hypothetical protein